MLVIGASHLTIIILDMCVYDFCKITKVTINQWDKAGS